MYYPLRSPPCLRLNYEGGNSDFSNKSIMVKVYREVSAQDFKNLLGNFTNSSLTAGTAALNMDSLYSEYQNSDSSIKSTPFSILQNVFNAVINGGKIVSSLNRKSENFDVKFTKVKEDANGWLNFTDMSIKFKNTGKFQLLFVVDGVESSLSDPITVKFPELTPGQYVK